MSAAPKQTSIIDQVDLIQIASPFGLSKNLKDFWIASGSALSHEDVLTICLDKNIHHVIDAKGARAQGEIQSAAVMMFDEEAFRYRPISCLLSPTNVTVETEKKLTLVHSAFSAAVEKPGLLDALQKAIEPLTKSVSLTTEALTVADEMITNAIFNAPYVSKDNQRSGISRVQPHVTMGYGKYGEFLVGSDGDRLVIGVSDPFGTLNIDALLKRIRNCYRDSVAATMRMDGSGGAGIGSYMIYNSSASLYLLVKEDQQTLVCSVMNLKGSNRVRAEASKNLHCRYINKG